jgi:hypothetical protein
MNLSSFFSGVTRKAGDVWRQADRSVGGWLPGGVASPISRTRQQAKDVTENAAKSVAAVGLNTLPDRVNLFVRYMTGVGNTNLRLDPSTLADLREATNAPMFSEVTAPKEFSGAKALVYKQGPSFPQSGPVNPYSSSSPLSVTNTLGRFTAEVNPSKNEIRFLDTYDMVNNAEDPDLVSGKIQPEKAWNEVESIWNPAAQFRNKKLNLPPGVSFNPPNAEYTPENVKKGLHATENNPTFSPATRFARALMYLAPIKPEPYEIDITVPYSGAIR